MTHPLRFVRIVIALLTLVGGVLPTAIKAHDTWVETNTAVVPLGELIYVSLMLGNHGNDHRDFKLAGKADPESSTLEVISPDGTPFDLKLDLIDNGYAPKEGFWMARFVGVKPGLYTVAHTTDKVVTYAPVRSIKSGKTFFALKAPSELSAADCAGFDRVYGHALELVPVTNPIAPVGPGKPITVQVRYQGKPLATAKVSFVPRGTVLREGFDERYERKSDAEGLVSFTPLEGNYLLIVAHHVDPTASGEGYQGTKYSATLTLHVPQQCPCCDALDE